MAIPPPDYTGVGSFIMRGINSSKAPVQLKNAYILSDITGEQREMVVDLGLDGRSPISQINPVPSGASITLILDLGRAVPLKEIAEQWIKMTFKAQCDDTTYETVFDLEKQLRAFPELKLGPRITKKKQ